jgi:hypothetical protein
MSPAQEGLLWLIGFALAILLIAAQLRIFSIDRTLKKILLEIRGDVSEKTVPSPEVIERLRQKGRLPKD